MKFKIFHEDQEVLNQCKRFIAGWHGLGEIGYITVSHMIEDLKLKRIATIMSSGAPPFISVQNSQLRLPFEIYGKEDYDFAIFIPHLQPYRHVQIEFSERMSEWILKQKSLSEAYFIGGVDARLKTSENDIQYIPTRAFLQLVNLNSEFHEEVKTNLLDPGLFVAGPLAIMLGYLDMSMFPAVGLLAYAQRERPDPLGAVATIKKLNEILDINIDTNELVQNAQTIEEEIKRQLAPIEENQADNLSTKRMYT